MLFLFPVPIQLKDVLKVFTVQQFTHCNGKARRCYSFTKNKGCSLLSMIDIEFWPN